MASLAAFFASIGFGGSWNADTATPGASTGPHVGSAEFTTFTSRTAVGSGDFGPPHADYAAGFGVSKDNWPTSTVEGEIDGMSIYARQGISGDVSGELIDVGKVFALPTPTAFRGSVSGSEMSAKGYAPAGNLTNPPVLKHVQAISAFVEGYQSGANYQLRPYGYYTEMRVGGGRAAFYAGLFNKGTYEFKATPAGNVLSGILDQQLEGLGVGGAVTGVGVPAGTTITATDFVSTPKTVTLSNPVVGTSEQTFTLTEPGGVPGWDWILLNQTNRDPSSFRGGIDGQFNLVMGTLATKSTLGHDVSTGTTSLTIAPLAGASPVKFNWTSAGGFEAPTSIRVGADGTAIDRIVRRSEVLTPGTVAANTTSSQSFTVVGLRLTDTVTVNGPSPAAATGVLNVRVSAPNTLEMTFVNFGATAVAPSAGSYQLLVVGQA